MECVTPRLSIQTQPRWAAAKPRESLGAHIANPLSQLAVTAECTGHGVCTLSDLEMGSQGRDQALGKEVELSILHSMPLPSPRHLSSGGPLSASPRNLPIPSTRAFLSAAPDTWNSLPVPLTPGSFSSPSQSSAEGITALSLSPCAALHLLTLKRIWEFV